MRRFWWIVKDAVKFAGGVAVWLGLAAIFWSRWEGFGVFCYVVIQGALGLLALILMCAYDSFKDRGERYDIAQRHRLFTEGNPKIQKKYSSFS